MNFAVAPPVERGWVPRLLNAAAMPDAVQLEVVLFGHPRLVAGGRELRFAKHQLSLSMLAYLIVHRGEQISRPYLAFTLFPDETEEHALAELRRYLSLAAKTLPPRQDGSPWISADAESVRWVGSSDCFVDVAEFERLAQNRDTLAQAVVLYRGEFLEDAYDDWIVTTRERLRSTYLASLSRLIQLNRSVRDFPKAIGYAQRLLAEDPWREDAIRQLMAARYGAGDAAGALAEYQRFAEKLKVEMRAEAMPETVAVRDAIFRNAALPGALDAPFALDASRKSPAPSLPFVGRASQLEHLRLAWGRAARGSGSVVFVGGEAGIGKTRLLAEIALTVDAEGGRAAVGSTAYPEAEPYQSIVEALRSAMPTLLSSPQERTALAVLAQVMPEVHVRVPDLAPPPALPVEREATRLLDTLARFAAEFARVRPALIGLEDLHWAGNATIAALSAIARRAAQAPLLLIVTYRDDEIERAHPLRAAIHDLTTQRLASHVQLGRFGRDEIGVVVDSLLTGGVRTHETIERLYHASEGNPFFLHEAIAELREEQSADVSTLRGMPLSSAAIVSARVGRLSSGARAVAEIAAVAGQAFNTDIVREIGGFDPDEIRGAVNELLDRGIIRDAGSRSSFDYAFTHHLIADAVYRAMDDAARTRRHARAAFVLERLLGERSDEIARDLAHHYALGEQRERAGLWYFAAAKRSARLYANEEALELAEKSLTGTPDVARRIEVAKLMEELHGRRGDREGQRRDIESLQELIEECAGDDAVRTALRMDVLRRRILLARSLGESDRELALIDELAALARRSPDPVIRADVALQRASHLILRSKPREALPIARRALATYERCGDIAKQVECLWVLVDAATNLGAYRVSHRYLRILRERAAKSGERATQARALAVVATEALLHQRYQETRDLTYEALAINLELGDREAEAAARSRIAVAAAWLGAFDEALEQFSAALEAYAAIGQRRGLATTLTNKTLLAMRLGLFNEAKDLIARSDALLTVVREARIAVANAVNLSFIDLHLGEPESARKLAEKALDDAREIDFPVFEAAALANLGNAERVLGEADRAIAHMEAGIAVRRKVQDAGDYADDLSDLALAYLQAGRIVEAKRTADELTAIAERSLGGAFWPQYVWWVISRVSREAGDAEGADNAARHAEKTLEEFAANILDPTTRAAFLAVDVNREILSAVRT